MTAKMSHSKMDDLWYSNLNLQEYMKTNKFSADEVRIIFAYRTKMAKFKENFRNGSENIPCPLCHIHFDKQSVPFQCLFSAQ